MIESSWYYPRCNYDHSAIEKFVHTHVYNMVPGNTYWE